MQNAVWNYNIAYNKKLNILTFLLLIIKTASSFNSIHRLTYFPYSFKSQQAYQANNRFKLIIDLPNNYEKRHNTVTSRSSTVAKLVLTCIQQMEAHKRL